MFVFVRLVTGTGHQSVTLKGTKQVKMTGYFMLSTYVEQLLHNDVGFQQSLSV